MREVRADCRIWAGKKAALFDLDGTLMDSMWMWSRIDQEYLGRFGFALSAGEIRSLQKRIEGMSMAETAKVFKERFQIPDPVEVMIKTWNEMALHAYAEKVFLKEGARELLGQMKEAGLRLSVVTSNSEELTRAALEANGVLKVFDVIRCALSVPRGKPAPDIYLAAAEDLSVSPSDCIVFEDVPMGALAGKNADMTVCGVRDRWALDREEELLFLVDFYIRSFTEILRPE